MKEIKIEKEIEELKPKYDGRQSFYKKAFVIKLNYKNCNIYILKSYYSIVAVVTESDGVKWAYINKDIDKDLLYSSTTIRHIKEFLRQYYKDEYYSKKDLIKYESVVDYVEILESDDISLSVCDYRNIANATTPEQKKWFKNMFENYKEKIERFSNGDIYLLTSWKHGVSNHYYIKLENRA